jgi:quinol monooxygenase YgiN
LNLQQFIFNVNQQEHRMHYILARITVKPEAAAAAATILAELAAQTRKEAGCVQYAVYHQEQSPHIFQTVEHWQSKADADAHMTTPHVGAAFAAAGPLLAGAPEILAYTKLA